MPQPAIDAASFAEIKALMGDTFNDVLRLTLETLPQQLKLLEQRLTTKMRNRFLVSPIESKAHPALSAHSAWQKTPDRLNSSVVPGRRMFLPLYCSRYTYLYRKLYFNLKMNYGEKPI